MPGAPQRFRSEGEAGDDAADCAVLSGAQSRNGRLAKLSIFSMQPFGGLVIGEADVGEKDQGAPQAAQHLPPTLGLHELISGHNERTRRSRGQQSTIGDEGADIAKPDPESLGDLRKRHLIGQRRNHKRILERIMQIRWRHAAIRGSVTSETTVTVLSQCATSTSRTMVTRTFLGGSMSYSRRSIGVTAAASAALGALAPIPATAAELPASPAVKLPSATYHVTHGDSVWAIAQRFGVSVSSIIEANKLGSSAVIHPGQRLEIPTASVTSAPAPAASPVAAATYTVKRGDTLSHIAARHSTTVAAIKSASGLTSDLIFPGQKLTLRGSAAPAAPVSPTASPAPAPSAATYTVKRGDTLSGIASRHGTTVAAIVSSSGLSNANIIYPGQVLTLRGGSTSAPAAPAPATPAPSAATRTHTVARGDTLSGIASRYGTTVSAIMQASKLSSTVIYPGQVLTVAGTAAPSGTGAQDLVPNTFLHYTYPDATVRSANENKAYLNSIAVPSRAETQAMVREIAIQYGVDPSLAQAHAFRESGFDARAVSPANAIGTMQVIPSSGKWASDLVGYDLNLLDPRDNIIAGVVIIRQLQRSASSLDEGIAAYYQGLGGVRRNGMYPDTVQYVQRVKASMAQFR